MTDDNRIYANPEEILTINKEINHAWTSADGPCPYCGENKECEHWLGNGWIGRKTGKTKTADALKEKGHNLAMLILQSDYYKKYDIKEAVDELLAVIKEAEIR